MWDISTTTRKTAQYWKFTNGYAFTERKRLVYRNCCRMVADDFDYRLFSISRNVKKKKIQTTQRFYFCTANPCSDFAIFGNRRFLFKMYLFKMSKLTKYNVIPEMCTSIIEKICCTDFVKVCFQIIFVLKRPLDMYCMCQQ